jgi:hypothetical protein
MLLPLLGDAIARRWKNHRPVRIWLIGTAVFVALGVMFVASAVGFNWVLDPIADLSLGKDPKLDVVDWTSLQTELERRGLLDRPGLVVGTAKWHEAGKIDYALGGRVPVLCLGGDARQYGLIANPDDYAGADVLIVAPRRSLAQIDDQFRSMFEAIEPIAPATITHAGRPLMTLPLFIGHRLRARAGPAGSP